MPIALLISLSLNGFETDVNARAALLINADTGRVLFEKSAKERHYPASTTKIATALYALECEGDLQREFVASGDAVRVVGFEERMEGSPHWNEPDGTSAEIEEGERLSFEKLLYGLMLASGNDAANVIAEGIAGSVPEFVERLNRWLEAIGCRQTHFVAPHGLHHDAHLTTAWDLAHLTRRALAHPEFRSVVGCGDWGEYRQFNQLLEGKRYSYPGAIGVKTGNLSSAGRCLVAAVEREGRTLIAVILGCKTNEERYLDAIRLFETAFREEEVLVELPRRFGRWRVVEPIAMSFYPSEMGALEQQIDWGAEELRLLQDGEVVASSPLRKIGRVRAILGG